MEESYSHEIAQVINDYLTEDDWHFTFKEETGLFRFGITIRGKLKRLSCIIDVKDNAFIVYAISPMGGDAESADCMAKMAEFICRANYGLKRGNFELDMRDGEIRYKSFVDCDGILPTKKMVRHNISVPALMFERYGEGILDILFRDSSAAEAIERCESDDQDALRKLVEELKHRAEGSGTTDGTGAEADTTEAEGPDQPVLLDPFGDTDDDGDVE